MRQVRFCHFGFLVIVMLAILYLFPGRMGDMPKSAISDIHAFYLRVARSKAAPRQVQEERRKRLEDLCTDSEYSFPGKSRNFTKIPNNEFRNLIVIDKLKVIYCFVPKVACTQWKRVLFVLNNNLGFHEPESINQDFVHNYFTRLQRKVNRDTVLNKLKDYKKFLFVRDPFVRLISAFRDKIARVNKVFYPYSFRMLKMYGNISHPPISAEKAEEEGVKPTFSHFVQYLLDTQTEKEIAFDDHWRQMYRLCHPCHIKYDFIGKLETLDEDTAYLLQLLNAEKYFEFPSKYPNQTTTSYVEQWFKIIPKPWREKLYQLYKPDFTLFGYPKPIYLFPDGEQ
ncbi:carbohydrate sulfotransferase 12-like [Callorhinchus milii]|uniref:carbohydrate sulfotransferase 12-like n=1 Tax=Callorhinchus milii TaxID=7868 RepID=UPI001C3FC905|nr:carbohydrate sulfotransferase 12-like [Callorhinchus milii]